MAKERTASALRSQKNRKAETTKRCAWRGDPKRGIPPCSYYDPTFEKRYRSQRQYCSKECGHLAKRARDRRSSKIYRSRLPEKFRKSFDRYRQLRHRRRLTHLLPAESTDQPNLCIDQARKDLPNLQSSLLVWNGVAERNFAKEKIAQTRWNLEKEQEKSEDGKRLLAEYIELNRDAGILVNFSKQEIELLRSEARKAIELYAGLGDNISLCRAFISEGNLGRFASDLETDKSKRKRLEKKAGQCALDAYNIITYENQRYGLVKNLAYGEVLLLTWYHQALIWKMRLIGANSKDIEKLLGLARDIDLPTVYSETWRELTGIHSIGRKWDKALDCLDRLDRIEKALDFPIEYHNSLTNLRPRIEFLFDTGRKDHREQAIFLIEKEYLTAYKANPHLYFWARLNQWKKKYGLAFELPAPLYGNGMLCFPYLDSDQLIMKRAGKTERSDG